MATVNGDVAVPQEPVNWLKFCEKHATLASESFFRDFLVFVDSGGAHPSIGGMGTMAPKDPMTFAKKFIEYFLEKFDRHIKQSAILNDNQKTISPEGFKPNSMGSPTMVTMSDPGSPMSNTSERRPSLTSSRSGRSINGVDVDPQTLHDDYSDNVTSASILPEDNSTSTFHPPLSPALGTPSSSTKQKSFFRRLSFRNFGKKKQHTLKNHQTNTSSPGHDETKTNSHRKHKHGSHSKSSDSSKSDKTSGGKANITGEIVKEGIVHVLIGEDAKGKSRWEKTRLVLLNTNGGVLLEFYSPPKVCIILK